MAPAPLTSRPNRASGLAWRRSAHRGQPRSAITPANDTKAHPLKSRITHAPDDIGE